MSEMNLLGVMDSCRDWLGKYRGKSRLALKPNKTEQVSAILSYCNDRKLAVVPQGGNTGLVGGSVPCRDEIVLSMGRMNAIHHFDELSGVIECDSGCILGELESFLEPRGCTVPLDLGAKGSCHIGGNVATNAGGLRYLRYGSLHGSVLGLEVVLPDGTLLNLMNSLRKDNTGYDLKQLFIGSEGTLGIITKVALACPPMPLSVQTSYLSCTSFEDATKILRIAKMKLGEILSAFEFLDKESIQMALQELPHLKNPLGQDANSCEFAIVVETRGSNERHDREKLDDFLEECMAAELIVDGTIAQDSGQAQGIWELRESVTEALRVRGATYKYDVSIPISQMYDIVTEARLILEKRYPDGLIERDGKPWKVVGYGHLGDGNLHLNISVPNYSKDVQNILEPWIYDRVAHVGGSISAEHGVGQMKKSALARIKPTQNLALMRRLKHLLDPNGIMNPSKVITNEI